MRLLRSVVIGGILVGSTAVMGEAQRGRRGAEAQGTESDSLGSTIHADLRIVFSSQDVQLIREHYRAKYRNLPPGLQKKLARGGQLPPGWQKKIEPFPVELERRLPRLSTGHHRGILDGHAVIYLPGGVVVDTAVLF